MVFGIKESANAAAIKAFVVNRVGDFGFALGIFLIFYLFGTVNYDEVFQQIPNITEKNLVFLGVGVNAVDLICLLLFIGAMGKSAQFFFILGYQTQWRDQRQFQPLFMQQPW